MKTVCLWTLALFFTVSTTAQNDEKNEIETLKIAFITDALDLGTAEAQKFWPVYNKYEGKEDLLRNDLHCGVYDKLDQLESMTDAEAEKLLENYMDLRHQEHELRRAYVNDLKKVISARKIMMLKKAEYDFHRKLLKKYRSGKKTEDKKTDS